MQIKQLKIRNFKGIQSLDVPFSRYTEISGRNESGKTSIFDAYLWLLFGKNSEDAKDFAVKPILENGEPVHNLDVEVEGVFDTFTLKRILKEKWQKKRGADVAEFIGNETEYYIDGVKLSAAQFQAFLNEIADEKRFKILSNPLYFSEELNWQERRLIIMDAIGADEIEKALKEKYELPAEVEKFKVQTRQEINALKNKVDEFPVRISELKAQLVEVHEKELKAELADIEKQIEALNSEYQRMEAESQGQLEAYRKALAEKNAIEKKLMDARQRLQMANLASRNEVETWKLRIKEIEGNIERLQREIARSNERLESLRKEYITVAGEKFIFNPEKTTCDYCGQTLPASFLEKQEENARVAFERTKNSKLKAITEEGTTEKKKLESLTAQFEKLEKELTTLKENQPVVKEVSTTPEIEGIERLLAKFQLPAQTTTTVDKSKLIALENRKREIISQLAQVQQNERISQRISELEKEWRANGQKLADNERALIRVEKYELELAKELEKHTAFFEGLKFKMFRRLINGAFEPICEVLYKEVPFSDLNHSAKIIVGMKIIENLQKLASLPSLPLWVDNAEAINELPQIEGQLIALYVSNSELTIKNL